jgi:hypothetical protein
MSHGTHSKTRNNFAVQALSNGLPDSSVIVDPETLCTLLAKAEKWNDKSTLQGIKPARIKRKYRQRTPAEQLTMSDEEKVIKEEDRRRTSPMARNDYRLRRAARKRSER